MTKTAHFLLAVPLMLLSTFSWAECKKSDVTGLLESEGHVYTEMDYDDEDHNFMIKKSGEKILMWVDPDGDAVEGTETFLDQTAFTAGNPGFRTASIASVAVPSAPLDDTNARHPQMRLHRQQHLVIPIRRPHGIRIIAAVQNHGKEGADYDQSIVRVQMD